MQIAPADAGKEFVIGITTDQLTVEHAVEITKQHLFPLS